MLTKNFTNFMAMILDAYNSNSRSGLLPVKATNGTTYYLTGYFNGYPQNPTISLATSASSTGIHFGRGTTAPTEEDYALESLITSGLSISVSSSHSLDGSGNPALQLDITVTNTSSADITVGEIGYAQSLHASTAQGSTSNAYRVCLLDRTVLDSPVTIPAGGYAVIRYTLKTILGS